MNDLKIDVFMQDKGEKVTFKRDLALHPFDMNDTIAAMELQQANLRLQEKGDDGKATTKDIGANIRAIAKFASKLFLGQFTTQEAMGIDPIENTKLYTWHSRAMGMDINEDVDDILGDEKK